jgi:hypothetical protein
MNASLAYLQEAKAILERIQATQLEAIQRAAEIFTQSISNAGLVHMFGSGHSRIFVEEMFPRHGSFPGFHPIVELSLTYHNPVVGSNGQRQAMFLEHIEGFGNVILRNFVFQTPDSFLIYSNSGVNEVVIDVALEAGGKSCPWWRLSRWITAWRCRPCTAPESVFRTWPMSPSTIAPQPVTPSSVSKGWRTRSARVQPLARLRLRI